MSFLPLSSTWIEVVNKERKIKAGVSKELQNFEELIRNLNFFEGLIKNLL
jgi:hypothetical protein